MDRRGAIRWPPIKLSDEHDMDIRDTDDDDDGEERDGVTSLPRGHVGTENFTLKNPLSMTESSSDPPRVLGWLQVKRIQFLKSLFSRILTKDI